MDDLGGKSRFLETSTIFNFYSYILPSHEVILHSIVFKFPSLLYESSDLVVS